MVGKYNSKITLQNTTVDSLITVDYSPSKHTHKKKKKKLVCQKSKLSFLANGNPRRNLIPNASNLKEGFCHRSYALWKKDLNGSSFNPQSSKEWSIKRKINE